MKSRIIALLALFSLLLALPVGTGLAQDSDFEATGDGMGRCGVQ